MSKGRRQGARKSVLGRRHCTSQSFGHEQERGEFEEMRAVRFGQKTGNQASVAKLRHAGKYVPGHWLQHGEGLEDSYAGSREAVRSLWGKEE